MLFIGLKRIEEHYGQQEVATGQDPGRTERGYPK